MKVLVLGSEGQIGAPLVSHLMNEGHKVSGVDNLYDETLDLRDPSQKVVNAIKAADFVFFLAYDVGGSKYLSEHNGKYQFVKNNLEIMTNTFNLLSLHEKPFIFASSQMAVSTDTPYGALKMVGEHATEALGGRSVRFWNVYGSEWHLPIDKWHVVSDFIEAAGSSGRIQMRTEGIEERQFLHVYDSSRALTALMDRYDELDKQVYDISSFEWTSVFGIALEVSMNFSEDKPVDIVVGDRVDTVEKVEPSRDILEFWQPEMSLEEGVKRIADEWKIKRSQGL